MTAAAKRRATYEDLLRVPEHLIAELIDGELYVMPRPALPHVRAGSVLGSDIGTPFDWGPGGPGGWIILQEPELQLGEDVLIPDIAGWCRERMPKIPKVLRMDLAPDWICEILSPSTRNIDRTIKAAIYAREGVRHLWLIDPIARALEVYRLEGGIWNPVADFCNDAVVRAEPFHAIELDLARLWIETDD